MRGLARPRSSASIALAAALMLLMASARGAPLPPDAAQAGQAKALQAEATKLFRLKKYAAACEKFQAAEAAAPADPALLTDLALCQQKLGNKDEAMATNLRAIASQRASPS